MRIDITSGMDVMKGDLQTLLRLWGAAMDERLDAVNPFDCDRLHYAMDSICQLIDMDMVNNCELVTEELAGSSMHGDLWEDAKDIAAQYGLTITTYGLEMAMLGVEDLTDVQIKLAMVKFSDELRTLALGRRPEAGEFPMTANDVARTFNYGIPTSVFLEQAWRLQTLSQESAKKAGITGQNLLVSVMAEHFMFNLPSDTKIRDKIFEALGSETV